jgi:hypothetical protein
MSSWALNDNGYLNIYFHPWEFSDLASWGLPGWLKNPNGEKMLEKLATYLLWLKKRASFIACADFTS